MCSSNEPNWQTTSARVVRGHRVASGANGDPRFPGGTIAMQTPFFKTLGLDLSRYFSGTLNVSIAPMRYRIAQPHHTFRQVRWHPTQPAEDFSFIDVRLLPAQGAMLRGWIYYPHPETKPEHFQQVDVLECLLPRIENIDVGAQIQLCAPTDQILFHATRD